MRHSFRQKLRWKTSVFEGVRSFFMMVEKSVNILLTTKKCQRNIDTFLTQPGTDMLKPHRHNLAALAIPFVLLPVAAYLLTLERANLLFGFSSDLIAGFLCGLSLIAFVTGFSTLLLKRKPK